jgi:hypothetical protein
MGRTRLSLETESKMTKTVKTGLKGTSITEKDAEEIIDGVQAMYEKIPPLFRPMLPSLPDVLRGIPPSAGKYTLADIIQLLDWAYQNGRLKR